MRAAILRAGQMVVDEIDDLLPGPGQVLVETIACGICGSDLHAVDHLDHMVEASLEAGGGFARRVDPSKDLVMGHEMSCRVLAVGAGVEGVAEGSEHAAMPYLETPAGPVVPGYDNSFPGGYGERMLVSPFALVPIPNGLDPVVASLTEPIAVGLHAVNESSIGSDPRLASSRAAIVVGAGPVGLAIIAALAARGHPQILASDFSPTRRAVAETMGAHVVLDPAIESPFDRWRQEFATDEPPVVFEAVGVPGMIAELMRTVPERSEILVAGVCIPPDTFRPMVGIVKHLTLKFVLGWSPEEFVDSLRDLAEGRVDGAALITGEVDLDGVPQAFADLADPESHVKVIVRPNREAVGSGAAT